MNRILTAAAIALATAGSAMAADGAVVTRSVTADFLFTPADVARLGAETRIVVSVGETVPAPAAEVFAPVERGLLGLSADAEVSVTSFGSKGHADPLAPAPGRS